MSAVKIYVPCDSAALSVGADRVAKAIAREAEQRGIAVEIVRNGTRGMLWLEPLVEVETAGGRVAYGPVRPADVASLFDVGFLAGAEHPLGHGLTTEIPYFKQQERLTFERCGVIDPLSLDDYRAHGGLAGLEKALAVSPAEIVDTVIASGLRGRGGAGFPTGIKWKTVLGVASDQKYVTCNADEGDSGTFADRMLMEGDPFTLIEGMIIAGLAVGADTGFIYLRSEYPHAHRTLLKAIEIAEEDGLLGKSVLGSKRAFNLHVRLGAGSYVCGEETAMLESIEGKRGVVRAKPPIPAFKGLFGKPTAANNVMSLATIPWIMAHGGPAYAAFGMGRSLGTLTIQLAGNIKRGGLIEKAFGVTLREIIETYGGGTLSGRPFKAVQVGGPLGAYFPESLLDTPMDYEAMAKAKGLLGHGGMVVFDDRVDLANQARFAFQFCAEESCGKCTPCRIGATRGVEIMDTIIAGEDSSKTFQMLDDLCDLMTDASLCAMGGLTPVPVMSALTHFPDDFRKVPEPMRRAAE
ncbi:MAG: NADH-quinone oxidoreductase subunit NuoF [Beijerinckiaceae bacterium]|nr:NADH-quinone oxidoreductase subunit NuoF [Beijerinckiaceae bacterium]